MEISGRNINKLPRAHSHHDFIEITVRYPKLVPQYSYQPPPSLLALLIEYKRSHLLIEHRSFEQALIIRERNNDIDHVANVIQF